MTDSTPPGGLDSPPSTGTPQPLPPPMPARQPCQQRTPSTQHASASTTPSTPKDKDRGQRQTERRPASAAPLAYQHAAPPPACYQQTAAARLHPVPPGIRHGIQSARHDQKGRGRRERKGRRATDEEPRQRTRNFFARPYIGRTPPRYTPKDTPAACILHRLQRPFSACLASRADRLQFCFWRVCRTRRPKRPTTDATNARPPAPCPPVDGSLTFSARRHF